jgi:hypothetical protein
MRFQVRRHETATWNEDAEQTALGPAVETVMEFEAEYPAIARERVQDLERSTRVETTTRTIRGKRETLTVYLPNPVHGEAVPSHAWRTADGAFALYAV